MIVGGAGLLASLTGVAVQLMPRQFSGAQQRRIESWEVGQRWRTLPAGDIFPATVRYELTAAELDDVTGTALTAQRVGIAPQARCVQATDPAAAKVFGRHGCRAILRADYVDGSGTFVVTVGVAVLPTAGQAADAQQTLAARTGLAGDAPGRWLQPRPGLRAVAFAGTLAAGFGDDRRQVSASVRAGPYIVMYTAGYTDGRPRVRMADDAYADGEMTTAAQGVVAAVARRLAAPAAAPRCPGAPGC